MQVITTPGLSDEAAAARSADGIPVGHDLAIVIDLGGQYAPLIARRIREHGTFSHLVGAHVTAAEIAAYEPSAIVLSGGPASVNEQDAPTIDPAVFEMGIPMLGVCYGMQLMARELGGAVGHSGESEYGRATITRTADASTLLGIFSEASVWMSHRDCVTRLPEGFVATTTSDLGIASIENTERQLYAVQFHPEVTHTDTDGAILEAFLHEIAGARADWTAAAFIDEQVESIRAAVGDGHAIVGLSGGVDSAVAAALAHRALGERLTCVFVDHGLNRAGEREQVQEIFGNAFHMQLITVDAATEFIAELAGVEDPEAKRLRIGERFIRVFERAARDIDNADHLVQGTLYSDVIESGGGSGTANIKSHHNVGGLPEDLGFALVEPLRELFKDEVRQVGRELGLPDEVVNRHPFPGPGLAIRIIGEVTRERLDIVRAADAIVREEIHAAGLGGEVWQAFAVLPALKSVGVQGDGRTYGYPIVIRAVQSDDAMTADWVRLPHEVIETMSSRITNEVEQINRVVYDVTSKPPATIEWE